MSPIHLAGPFLWLWGLWHLCWLAGFVAVLPLAGPEVTATWFVVLYAWFLPQEIAGVLRNRQVPDGRARTLSEWRQYVAMRSRNRPGWVDDVLSWRGLAGATGVLDAGVMGLIIGANAQAWMVPIVGPDYAPPVGACVGLVWGLGLAAWLIPHFGWREWLG